MSIRLGSKSSVIVDRLACEDQRNRLEDIQEALHHAQSLMEAVTYDRIENREARAATFFAAFALEFIAEGQAEDAVNFMVKFCARLEDSTFDAQALLDAAEEGGAA